MRCDALVRGSVALCAMHVAPVIGGMDLSCSVQPYPSQAFGKVRKAIPVPNWNRRAPTAETALQLKPYTQFYSGLSASYRRR